MKILLPLVALLNLSNAHASLISVMDSGTDMSHKDLTVKSYVNTKEKAGTVDVDGDGLPGNVYGYDFTTNTPNPFDAKYNYLITNDVKNFFNYYAKYELGTITAQEMQALRTLSQNDKVMNDANFIGGYIHGTHVAGISTINVPNAKILPFKIIPTVYQDPTAVTPPTDGSVDNGSNDSKPVADNTPVMSIDELKAELIKESSNNIEEMAQIHKVINFHKVDVVNQSFGIGYVNAQDFIASAFIETQKREPTKEELESLVRAYMNSLVTNGVRMYQAAPDTVFCVAAGNDTNNNDLNPDYPSNIQVENKISVAATQGYTKIADFSNYGPKTVDVAAPGVAITATAPTNTYIPLSGTSQATPFVTNTIAQMKDANPSLKPRDIKQIIMQTVDVKPWLASKVKSSGIVNKVRAIKAAVNMKTMSIEQAISKAKAEVSDVAFVKTKSLGLDSTQKMPLGFKFNLKRPSLLIKK